MLDIDLNDVALSSAKETLQTGMHVSSWLNLFDELLVPGTTELIWRDSGPGKGRELKRSFSNILGRFFARAYLETNEGVSELISIEGKKTSICNARFRVQRIRGETGDMPDWIGWTGSGFVVAEAKGSHANGNWSHKRGHARLKGLWSKSIV